MNDISVIEAEFGDLSRWQECPDFWLAKPERSMPFVNGLKQATVQTIGSSAGGREIIAIEYGEPEARGDSCDSLHSALASTVSQPDPTCVFPESFYGTERRKRPVLAIQGGIHGGELTGTVAGLNLCQIIETGCDLRGKSWSKLQDLALASRVVFIPWLNIDGVERWPLENSSGVPPELYSRCTQGVAKDGTKYRYPAVKNVFPIPPETTAFMGTYYNDAGVNLQYDFTSVYRQPETVAWMTYYLREKPDGILIWHCNSGSMLGDPCYYLPEGFQLEFCRLAGAVQRRMGLAGIELGRLSWAGLRGMGTPVFEQMTATYHVCGGMPIMCELPCGTEGAFYSCDEMLDIGLLTIEETLDYAHNDGLRPYEYWRKVRKNLS